jgi:hypothetical protein
MRTEWVSNPRSQYTHPTTHPHQQRTPTHLRQLPRPLLLGNEATAPPPAPTHQNAPPVTAFPKMRTKWVSTNLNRAPGALACVPHTKAPDDDWPNPSEQPQIPRPCPRARSCAIYAAITLPVPQGTHRNNPRSQGGHSQTNDEEKSVNSPTPAYRLCGIMEPKRPAASA